MDLLNSVLSLFPPHTRLLTLVSDPDDILADEQVLAKLAERGFTLLNEPDPMHLRHRVESTRPFSIDRPLIVVTPGLLEDLPYDLWQHAGVTSHSGD